MSDCIEPFKIAIPQTALVDLSTRLAATRWPDAETVDDWSQGVPADRLKALCEYWQNTYDWRRCETMLNRIPQFKTTIDGLSIHFLHVRSNEPSAKPLVMTHGWPGSIVEFIKVIAPLTDPVAHGGKPEDAFHLVIPSLPGYGFSEKPRTLGWNVQRIAGAWTELMARLGYDRWYAQGGDWGAAVTTALGKLAPGGLAGIHLNMPLAFPNPAEAETATEDERAAAARLDHYNTVEAAYARQQATRPQTLGYCLADSPTGQAAWIYEKLRAWSDCNGEPENIFSFDEMLDNISIYWLTSTATSSARLYWEGMNTSFFDVEPVHVPTGCSLFPAEIFQPSQRQIEGRYPYLVYFNRVDKGGHFAAWEQPEVFVSELRDCFGKMQ